MEKTARRPSADPTQERLRANKANWNKEVSAFINDLIHFKKLMNGWPSKFFKERSRITQPLPADPATIIGSLAGDFQEIATRGNGIIEEQLAYAKNRRQKQPKPAAPAPGQAPQAPAAPAAPEAPKAPDLTQQIQKGLAASEKDSPLIKLAAELENKYEFETYASNPFSRFITRLFNPKFGFGEAARMRRLRMTMLDYCVKSYKELKKLHKEIVKSGTGSIVNSHKIMAVAWNYWNPVNRLFSTFKTIRPQEVAEDGGPIADAERSKEKGTEKGKGLTVSVPTNSVAKLEDYRSAATYLGSTSTAPSLHELHGIIETITAAPDDKSKAQIILDSNFDALYEKALKDVNMELGTSGKNFREVVVQMQNKPVDKTAQKQLGKLRHQLLPGATSGQRLEVYNLITQIRADLNQVMDLLENGFDQTALTSAIGRTNRDMVALRTMLRSLYLSEKPEEAGSFSFF